MYSKHLSKAMSVAYNSVDKDDKTPTRTVIDTAFLDFYCETKGEAYIRGNLILKGRKI